MDKKQDDNSSHRNGTVREDGSYIVEKLFGCLKMRFFHRQNNVHSEQGVLRTQLVV